MLTVTLVLGLIVGFLASRFADQNLDGIFVDIGLGIVGALAGGILFSQLWPTIALTDIDLGEIASALVAAVAVLIVSRRLSKRSLR